MKLIRASYILCLASLVTACGGGSSGGNGPAPIPAPPAAAPRNSTLTNLQYSETFGGSSTQIGLSVSRTTGAASTRTAPSSSNSATVAYNAGTQSYTVSGISSSFGASERIAGSSNATLTGYQRNSGSRQENLVLFNPGAGNPSLALTYASYGAYQGITESGTRLDVDTNFFTFGIKTAPTDMPRTGSAGYTTRIDGQFADGTGVYALGGTSSFVADFAASTFALNMTPVGQHILTGAGRSFGSFSANGSFASTGQDVGFSGSGQNGQGYNLSIAGHFFGPQAAEMAGTFALTGNQGVGAGAIIGKKQ